MCGLARPAARLLPKGSGNANSPAIRRGDAAADGRPPWCALARDRLPILHLPHPPETHSWQLIATACVASVRSSRLHRAARGETRPAGLAWARSSALRSERCLSISPGIDDELPGLRRSAAEVAAPTVLPAPAEAARAAAMDVAKLAGHEGRLAGELAQAYAKYHDVYAQAASTNAAAHAVAEAQPVLWLEEAESRVGVRVVVEKLRRLSARCWPGSRPSATKSSPLIRSSCCPREACRSGRCPMRWPSAGVSAVDAMYFPHAIPARSRVRATR